jgi:hypothetical protein
MLYLESVTEMGGGRRGRAAVATPTSEPYALTRQGTEPCEGTGAHGHELIANVGEMLGDRRVEGGATASSA